MASLSSSRLVPRFIYRPLPFAWVAMLAAVAIPLFFPSPVNAQGAPLPPADISGLWRWSRLKPDGTVATNYLTFHQTGTSFTGQMEFAWGGTSDIVDGSVDGKTVRFKRNGDPPPAYAGTLDGDRLHLTVTLGNVSEPVELQRLPAGTPMFPDPPAPPPLHHVPSNGLLKTPPMGWNAWNHFKQNIDDKTVRQITDAMISSGMRDAGYIYVNIDDEWAGARDAQGNIHPNRNFPDMKALADYVHGKGMKLGLYSSPGPETCEGHLGSMGREEQDARSYASWDVDYLKYDWCAATFVYKDADMHALYQKMGDALVATGRPIAYSLCQYGKERVPEWGPSSGGNLWRTTPDISDGWNSMYWIWTEQQKISQFNEPGGWNDPDMLEVGNGGMTDEEYRTHFSLWAFLSAPLLAGNDPRSMSPATMATLTNKEVIALDQDPLAAAPKRLAHPGAVEVWLKPLADGGSAFLLLNPTTEAVSIDLAWKELGVSRIHSARDLWSHRAVPAAASNYRTTIPGHGVRVLKLATGRN